MLPVFSAGRVGWLPRRATRCICSHHDHGSEARVRFAPSPTGELHLGGLRTALYNYLCAKKTGGTFIVRIEDTDRARLVEGSADRIRSLLTHYGLQSDEDPWKGGPAGPYTQSERLPLYKEHAEALIDAGAAYRCFCTSQRLELLRKEAARNGTVPMYDRRCRSISAADGRARAANGEEHVIRFVLDHQNVHFEDAVFGPVTQHLEESDPVLLKSDGFPTYHLANIVDDHTMRISDVIRGMEWLSSTGKHVLMYKAFSWRAPRFAHLPLITRDGKKKLSKRDKARLRGYNDAFASFYDVQMGVLPQAVLNFLVRNGSGIRDFEPTTLYSLDELVERFDVNLIGRRNLMLDSESLTFYGGAAIREACDEQLLPLIRARLARDLPAIEPGIDDAYLKRVVGFLKQNEETFSSLSQLTDRFSFLFTRPTSAEKLVQQFPRDTALAALERVVQRGTWNLDKLKETATSLGLTYPRLLGILRISLLDDKSGPPIRELCEFFGEKECTARVQTMIQYLKAETALPKKSSA